MHGSHLVCSTVFEGHRLKELLRFDSDADFPIRQLAQRGAGIPVSDVQRQLPQPWSDLIASYLQALLLNSKGEMLAACKEFRFVRMILGYLRLYFLFIRFKGISDRYLTSTILKAVYPSPHVSFPSLPICKGNDMPA